MTTRRRTPPCVLAGAIAIAACACAGSSQGERVRDARMERIEARAEAEQGAAGPRAQAQDHVHGGPYAERREAVPALHRSGKHAESKLAEVARERTRYESDARARLTSLASRINAARQKLHTLGANAPLSWSIELQTAVKEYELVKDDVMELDRTHPDDWDRKAGQIDARERALGERVSKLEDAIDGI